MSIRIATATAIFLALAAPAFADCNEELAALDQAVVTAETGASTDPSGMPATEHQKQVLGGKETTDTQTTGSTTGTVNPVTPHQEQVTGMKGAGTDQHASQLMAEARKLAQAGNEQACMDKVAQIKDMLGMK
jgi:hypothetical protein